MGKEQWAGAMGSSFIWHVMTEGKSLLSSLLEQTSATKTRKFFKVLSKRLYVKLFADKGYISQKLFDFLFEDGIQLVTGLRVNMKNKLMPFYDRMMLRKRYIIETINDFLKNTAQIEHSRHRSVTNFIMNLVSALGAIASLKTNQKLSRDIA